MIRPLFYVIGSLGLLGACSQAHDGRDTSEAPSATDPAEVAVPRAEYEAIDHDTVRLDTMVRVGNDRFLMQLISYSLNDSAVLNTVFEPVDDSLQAYQVRSHNRACRVRFDYQTFHLDTVVTKELFRDSLSEACLANGILARCTFRFVRSNTLYFSTLIGRPRTDDVAEVHFQFFFRGPKFGRMYHRVLSDHEMEANEQWGAVNEPQ